jgi:hypothetical protein
MKLNIINLIDNFKKFSNLSINHYPSNGQEYNSFDYTCCIEFFKDSQCCLIFEHKPKGALKLFNLLLEKGNRGIIITRNHPDKFCSNLMSRKIDTYWLSAEDFDYVIHPWETNLLVRTVSKFIAHDNKGVVLLNGLEYLSTYNESHVILNTIFRMVKLIANTEAKFLITIDPIALGNQFITTIKNKSEIVLLPSNPIKEVLN